MRAALYCRVSTQEQVEHGTSLREQERRLREFVAEQGWDVQDLYSDQGVSGASLTRPAYLRMMEAAEQGLVDVIVAASADRLTRRQAGLPLLFEELEPYEVAVVTLDGIDSRSDAGELYGGILSVMSGVERKRIKARTMRGRMAAAREGKFVGTTPPYGYARQRLETGGWTLVIEPAQARSIQWMVKRLVEEGGLFSIVLNELKRMEAPSPDGGPWDSEQLGRFMRRPEVPMRCAGRHSFNGVEQTFPAIISPGQAALWLEWQGTRARPQTERGTYLLSGILRMPCGGGAMGRQVKHLRPGRKNQPAVYACRQHFVPKDDLKYHADCASVYLEPVDLAVREAVRNRLRAALESVPAVPAALELEDLEARREQAIRRIEDATQSLILAGVTGEAFVRALAQFQQDLRGVEQEMREREREHARLNRSTNVRDVLSLAQAALRGSNIIMWRQLLMALHVEVRITGYTPCPECWGTGYQPAAGRPRGFPPPCERCRRAKQLPHLALTMDDVVAAKVMQGLR